MSIPGVLDTAALARLHFHALDLVAVSQMRHACRFSHWPRFANPRDANEQALLMLAERLSAHWLEVGPLDGWVWVRGAWVPVEIKRPEREGHAWEYTPAQRRFLSWCRNCGARWWVWRTDADVIRDLGGRVAA